MKDVIEKGKNAGHTAADAQAVEAVEANALKRADAADLGWTPQAKNPRSFH